MKKAETLVSFSYHLIPIVTYIREKKDCVLAEFVYLKEFGKKSCCVNVSKRTNFANLLQQVARLNLLFIVPYGLINFSRFLGT